MITLEEMRALETNSAWRGVSRRLLMENAGSQVAREILRRKNPEEKVVILAGTGNNGGDGFVAARHLVNKDVKVEVILLGRPRNISTSAAEENWKTLTQMENNVEFHIIRDSQDFKDLDGISAPILVDALLGTGITGGLREPVASAVELINDQGAYTVAVDVPTGLNPSTGEVHGDAVRCDLTVTFHDSKPGLEKGGEDYVGELVVADIGIPHSAERLAGPGDVKIAIPPRSIGSHKGQNGRVLIVGGGSHYAGAPALAGLAALRSGADLSTIAAPEGTANIVNSFSPDLITLKLPGKDLQPDAVPKLEGSIGDSTAVIIGPGLGLTDATREALLEFMEILVDKQPDLPVLLDADGLKIVSEKPRLLREGNPVLTPHAGEFKILTGSTLPSEESKRIEMVSGAAEDLDSVIMLKGHVDICAAPDGRAVLNDTGNPGMTVGGTGDVLAGVTGSFLSRGAEPFRAGSAALFLNGLAGDICHQDMGYEFTASDVKDKIPLAISKSRDYW